MNQSIPENRKAWVAAGLFLTVLILVATTLHAPGLAWDEPAYITASQSFFVPWFSRVGTDATNRDVIERYWKPSSWAGQKLGLLVHPPLGQLMIGATWWTFRGLVGDVVAARLATAILFSILVALVFLYVSGRSGETAGLASALALLFIPRVFGHAQLAAIDLHVAVFWFAATACFAWGMTRPVLQPLSGLLVGVALLTKATAIPLPFLLGAWAFLYHGRKAIRPCLFLLLAIPVFSLWPLMWVDTVEHLKFYLGVVQNRPEIPVLYFGRVMDCTKIPFHYPLVMLLLTTPVVILAGLGKGIHTAVINRITDPDGILILGNFAALFAIVSLPGIARYDGIRLFLPLYPFLAVLAGPGIVQLGRAAVERWHIRKWVSKGTCALCLVAGISSMIAIHPFYLSHFNILSGGLPGAEQLGLEITYWGETVDRSVVQYVNENAPQHARLAIFPHTSFVMIAHGDIGTFRDDISLVDPRSEEWNWIVINARRGKFTDRERKLFDSGHRLFERSKMGVPLCRVISRIGDNSP